jgi:hypothetical protein
MVGTLLLATILALEAWVTLANPMVTEPLKVAIVDALRGDRTADSLEPRITEALPLVTVAVVGAIIRAPNIHFFNRH